MRKILIVVPSFNFGGTSSALINFVTLLNNGDFSFYVYAITNDGPVKQNIAEKARIIGEDNNQQVTKRRGLKIKIFLFAKALFKALRYLGIDLTQFTLRKMANKLDAMGFDVAIAFQEGTATWLVSKMRTPRKIAWVRCQYSRYLKLANIDPETRIYQKFDKVVSVSKFAVGDFVKCIPSLRHKTTQIYDILNAGRVLNMASEEIIDYKKKEFTLVSIGRLDPVKRFSYIPQIASDLVNRGFKFKWLIIGGASRQNRKEALLINDNIKKHQMEDVVMMLGAKANPYKYLANSDIMVSLSSSETFNYTLTEAKILGIPIVTTNYACAYESLDDKLQGRIVSIEKIADTIYELMSNQSEYLYMKNQLKKYTYSNSELLNKIKSEILN